MKNEWIEKYEAQEKRIKELETAFGELLNALNNCPGEFNYPAGIEDSAINILKNTGGAYEL